MIRIFLVFILPPSWKNIFHFLLYTAENTLGQYSSSFSTDHPFKISRRMSDRPLIYQFSRGGFNAFSVLLRCMHNYSILPIESLEWKSICISRWHLYLKTVLSPWMTTIYNAKSWKHNIYIICSYFIHFTKGATIICSFLDVCSYLNTLLWMKYSQTLMYSMKTKKDFIHVIFFSWILHKRTWALPKLNEFYGNRIWFEI
jgi:hypothetical protein